MRATASALLLTACSALVAGGTGRAADPAPRVALLPIENLTGAAGAFDDVERALAARLDGRGVALVGREDVLSFLAARRIRYTGGLALETLRALSESLGVDAVVITSAELWIVEAPPRIALSVRLVGTRDGAILWADEAALAGEDRPGLLGLERVDSVATLADRIADRLAVGLAAGLAGAREGDALVPASRRHARPPRAFQPQQSHAAPELGARADRPWAVAVLPFESLDGRSELSATLAALFVTHLSGREGLAVIEPGEVRETLLRHRVIQHSGLSLAQADLLRVQLQADLVVTGQLLEYEDRGPGTNPRLSFSVRVIDTARRAVVWSCLSTHRGDDGPTAFDAGRLRTGRALASAMVRAASGAFAASATRRQGRAPA